MTERLLQIHQENDDFYQLVRLLERQARLEKNIGAGSLIGSDYAAADEPLRFHSTHQTGFPGRALERLWQESVPGDSSSQRTHLAVNFMGLTGPTGTLPRHYTNLVQERLRHRDRALADFLDLFNHRLIALFYRAWAKYRLPVQYEDHARAEQRDPITRALRALAGQQPFQQQETQLYYGGHFARHTRSAAALQHMLQDFLGHPVTIESFIGQWLPIQPADRAVLGRLGRNHHLGSGILIGKRVWDVQSKFRIIIGPLRQSDYEQLLPDRQRFQELSRLVNSYTPQHLNVELKFLINQQDT